MSDLWTADQKNADFDHFPEDLERDWRVLALDEILRWSGEPAPSLAQYCPLKGPMKLRMDERDREWMINWEDI